MTNMKFSNYAIMLAICWILLFINTNTVGRLEGLFLPVVNSFTIDSVESGGGRSELTGTFLKLRNCDFVDINWNYAVNGGISTTNLDIVEPAKVRTGGFHEYGPWYVNISNENVRDHSVVEVIHRCHPLWNTITMVYP